MKKILLIVPSLHQGGLEKVCVTTAKLLRPYCQVQIAIFDSKNIAYDITGIHVTDLRLASRPGKAAKILNVLKRGRKLHRLKKEEEIDIAYSFGPTANLANIASGPKAQKWLGIRSYMDMGNPKQIRLFCRCADRLICCSEAIREEVARKYGYSEAVTLNNPFDREEVEWLAEKEEAQLPWEDGRIIVSMGREDVVKGFWHLVKAFFLVHSRLPDTKLMIIGKGEFEPYKKLADELGIGDAVYFTGLKRNPYPYLKRSSLYVLTSYYEGFPNAMVEAMSLGIPVIATDCMTGPKEILENKFEDSLQTIELMSAEADRGCKYGILVPNMSPDEDFNAGNITEEEKNLAGEIVSLLKDEKRLEYYQEMARKRAGDYTTEVYIEKILDWAKVR